MTTTAAKKPARPAKPKKVTEQSVIRFSQKLVLNQWLLSLFDVDSFERLAQYLRDDNLKGLDETNAHRFIHEIILRFPNLKGLTRAQLIAYDQNVVRHTLSLNERRNLRGEHPVVWKYFQYLSLLFTEIYLDRYFNDAEQLIRDINKRVRDYNNGKAAAERLTELDETADASPQLNKLSYWMATGSGKTLLMHANILQYRHALERAGRRRELNRIILVTPNEGLTKQHLEEFSKAGIQAEAFNRDGRSVFAGGVVEIIEVTRLGDKMGDKTVAIEAFEGNNLVLVDEGHRGTSSGGDGAWMRKRNALCEKGFSFEYSATFGQAIKGNQTLTDVYAKSIICDYSYKYFHKDGYGKDYHILNLDEKVESEYMALYMVAALLSFYQQLKLYQERGSELRPFMVEKPLWVFVGGSVTAKLATGDSTDIVQILKFFQNYIAERERFIQLIQTVIDKGIVTAEGRDLLARQFSYLRSTKLSAEQIYDDSLHVLFNARSGGRLHLANIKNADGELAISIGDGNDPFGVINVGDDTTLYKNCLNSDIYGSERNFNESIFNTIKHPTSTVNVLIGSKKFTEGWSSWRVSTMSLMNVGKSEGSQIIQLFGRGVRLQGYDKCLKRSDRASLPTGVIAPEHIKVMETLGVFGIRAKYMQQFKEFLEDDDVSVSEQLEIILPVIRDIDTQKLKMIRLKQKINGVRTDFGSAYRRVGPVPTLRLPDINNAKESQHLSSTRLVVNWYPKIQAQPSKGVGEPDSEVALEVGVLDCKHIAFVDIDRVIFELERFKAERGWYNLNITRHGIVKLLENPTWYTLQIPKTVLEIGGAGNDSFARCIHTWQEIAIALLKKYIERFYTFRKREWELPHLEYRELDNNDPNFQSPGNATDDGYYRVLIDSSKTDIVEKIEQLKQHIINGELKEWDFNGLKAVMFDRHLYKPLLYLDSGIVEISPTPLNAGEMTFVQDLKTYYERHRAFFDTRELYLLRNLSRGKGVGFFEAGNFHPDFILWLLDGAKQYVTFIDPKGLRNLSIDDPKIQFHKTIKEIEQRLNDPSVVLGAYIVSVTDSTELRVLWNKTKDEMTRQHIVFQREDKDSYIGQMLMGGEEEKRLHSRLIIENIDDLPPPISRQQIDR